MKVTIVGAGHVGLVTGACMAELGNDVLCVDNDVQKISLLNQGVLPLYEPGLGDMVTRNREKERLRFSTSMAEGVESSEVIFITVGTPAQQDGSPDMSHVEAVAREIARCMKGYRLIIEKSTVPVRTGEWVKRTIRLHNGDGADFDVASVPEFLREGSAVQDFLRPDRIVAGVESPRAEGIIRKLFEPLGAPLIITDIKSAEMIKHASNCFLAMKISYVNAVASLCELVGADIIQVTRGMGYDRRIGKEFLNAGVGYGGSCFPKDIAAFIRIATEAGYDFELLKVVDRINQEQRARLVKKVRDALWVLKGKTIAVLGLAFKPNTDDMREAPSVDVIRMLVAEGARVRAYDPVARDAARGVLPSDVEICADPYETVRGCDALTLLTEWDEFKKLELARVRRLMTLPVVVDGRNLFDPAEMARQGFEYRGIGR
ncbi:MAG: UDP-glucose/GDP-mannose dehydrogenase family protein [Chloroflexi bacterium]|nr:UDP-glucose/GDP-mannose dehydrogenase family protein [Chloroflexota bacterium]